jgi:LmbE family N-acetylglucosaminyl deacetylase
MFYHRKKGNYSNFEIKPSDKCLILAPHSDDESIGCGGFLIKYAPQCDVIILTDGSLGNIEYSPEENIAVRSKELKNAMEYLGVNSYECLNISDKKLRANLKKLNKIEFKKYDYIFVPNQYESHVDHYCIYNKVKWLLKFSKIKLVSYEVWSTLPTPTNYVDISDIVSKKRELIDFYSSQMTYINYKERILALNSYRGMRAYIDYAEAFLIED